MNVPGSSSGNTPKLKHVFNSILLNQSFAEKVESRLMRSDLMNFFVGANDERNGIGFCGCAHESMFNIQLFWRQPVS